MTATEPPARILTPDQRLRVFISSTLHEMADERRAALAAVRQLRLTPVMFELGARPHPPRDLYRAYLAQSHIVVCLYWQSYGWVAPDMDISGLEDEYRLSAGMPRLVYVKRPAPEREPGLAALLKAIQSDDVSYRAFGSAEELQSLLVDDLAVMLSERFAEARFETPPSGAPLSSSAAAALPTPRDPLIGRRAERAEAASMLADPVVRLVTFTGPGGTGKSRLALHVGHDQVDRFRDGVAVVDLTSLNDPRHVMSAIAATFGVGEANDGVMASVVSVLSEREMLLLIDNVEHVIDAAPELVVLLERCPGIKILATSRAPLRVRGENELPVGPLVVPPREARTGPEQVSQYEAVQLFVQRAREVRPSFEIDLHNAPAIAEICARLDGLPLAIELAASRIRVLTPDLLLSRLDSRLDALTGGARDLPEHQRTLRSAIAWSHDLLSEREQTLFARLSVFAGGWTLQAAEAVTNPDRALGQDVLELLEQLVDASLVLPMSRDGHVRFTMLETIHEFAAEQLASAGEEAGLAQRRHVEFFAQLAERAEPELQGASQAEWFDCLQTERDNLRVALTWMVVHDPELGLNTASALYRFWESRDWFSEGRSWLASLLSAHTEPDLPRGRGLNASGALADIQGDYGTARAQFEESLAIHEALGNDEGVAALKHNLGLVASYQLDYEESQRLLEESLEIKRRLGNRWRIANSMDSLGAVAGHNGQWERARDLHGEALQIFEELGDTLGATVSLSNLAHDIAHLEEPGALDRAEQMQLEALGRYAAQGSDDGCAEASERLACIAGVRANHGRVVQLFAGAEALRLVLGSQVPPTERSEYATHLQHARQALGERDYAKGRAEGLSLDREGLLHLAGYRPSVSTFRRP